MVNEVCFDVPEISVIIPAYNHEKYIAEAIESILNQSFQNWELIIINDGSTDRTGLICESYNDSRIRYYCQKNSDAYNTINRGISLARGDFISILNSDDVYHKDRLKILLEKSKKENLDCIFSRVQLIDKSGDTLTYLRHYWNHWYECNLKFYLLNRDLFNSFLYGNLLVSTSNLFIRKKIFKNEGLFSKLRYLHDYEFMLRILKFNKYNVGFLHNKILLKYRLHNSNTICENPLKVLTYEFDMIKSILLEQTNNLKPLILKTGLTRLNLIKNEILQYKNIEGRFSNILKNRLKNIFNRFKNKFFNLKQVYEEI